MAGPCHAFRARCGGDGRRWSGGRELPAPHRRLDPRRQAAAAVARPPLIYCDGAVLVGVEPLQERLDLRTVDVVAGGGELAQQLL